MSELRKSNSHSDLDELEKIFQQYKGKLEQAEHESDAIIEGAWKKAEAIIAEKQREAQKIIDDAKQRAKLEAEATIMNAKNRAAEIDKEADNRSRKEAKDRTKKEVERILAAARQIAEHEAAEIKAKAEKETAEIIKKAEESAKLQTFEEADAIITEAKANAKTIDEGSVRRAEEINGLIIELAKKADEIVHRFKSDVQKEVTSLTDKLSKARDNLEVKSAVLNESAIINKRGIDYFKGLHELVILPPCEGTQIEKLIYGLKQIPKVKLEGQSATEKDFSVYVNINEPIPLRNILQQLSIVETSDAVGNKIKLKLKNGSNGA